MYTIFCFGALQFIILTSTWGITFLCVSCSLNLKSWILCLSNYTHFAITQWSNGKIAKSRTNFKHMKNVQPLLVEPFGCRKIKDKQVLNPQKGVSGPHSFKLSLAIWMYPAVTSWRSESSNICLFALDKLLFGFRAQ